MIRSVTTLATGVAIAVLIIVVAVLAAIGVIGLSAKAALFGEPKASLALRLFDRFKNHTTDISPITHNNGEDK